MKRSFVSVSLLLSVVILLSGCATARCGRGCSKCVRPGDKPCCADLSKFAHYGEKMKMEPRDTVCVEKVMADKAKYDGKFVRVCGKVDSVCAAKGCWLRLGSQASKETLFVKFTCPVEGRLIPMDATGRVAIVEGTLEVTDVSEAEARHYAQDGGKSAEEVAKIVGPQKEIKMKAPAALISGA